VRTGLHLKSGLQVDRVLGLEILLNKLGKVTKTHIVARNEDDLFTYQPSDLGEVTVLDPEQDGQNDLSPGDKTLLADRFSLLADENPDRKEAIVEAEPPVSTLAIEAKTGNLKPCFHCPALRERLQKCQHEVAESQKHATKLVIIISL